jgi:hypothetical protein
MAKDIEEVVDGEIIEGEVVDHNQKSELIIIAPHPDDEIIGTYKYLTDKKYTPIIIYSADLSAERKESTLKLKEFVNCRVQLFQMSIPVPLVQKENTFLFPDPSYELHPSHRIWGTMGEQLARAGYDVIFYSTNMNAPYIHEVKNPDEKRKLLEDVYPDQKSIWEFDHKYFLFEGHCKWVF